MSFDNNYPNRKDKRKQYRGSKNFDRSCRNHGSCDYCKNNRLYKNKVKETEAINKVKKWERYY